MIEGDSIIKLIEPRGDLFLQYKDMMDEWIMEGSRISPWPLSLKYFKKEYFEEMLKRVDDVKNGRNLDGYSSSTTYWLYDTDNDMIIGAGNLRDELVGESGKIWGHIGFGIRPSERRKGYATLLLKLILEKSEKKMLNVVIASAYEGNVGSWKTMEKCGFILKEEVIEEDTGLPIRVYYYKIGDKKDER